MKKKEKSIAIYKKIAVSFIVLTVILILFIIFFALSKARIEVVPKEVTFKAEFTETVKNRQTSNGDVAWQILQTNVRGTKEFQASFTEVEKEAQATGVVTLHNETSSPMTLIATTRLLSEEGVLFRMKKMATVPANGQIDVEVYADESGAKGNIGPATFSVPGLGETYKGVVYGKSSQDMKGGVKKEYIVTQENIDNAIETMKELFADEAFKEFQRDLKKEQTILRDAISVNIIDYNVDAKAGDSVETFNVSMNAQIQGIVADEKQIYKLAEQRLYEMAEPEYELVYIDKESLEYSLEKYDKVEQSAQIKISLQGKGIVRSASNVLNKESLAGKSSQEIKEYLLSKPGIKDVFIHLSPFWLKNVPKLHDHIEVEIKK
jgi:hypothetical protein